jgi:WD40 repeat protein
MTLSVLAALADRRHGRVVEPPWRRAATDEKAPAPEPVPTLPPSPPAPEAVAKPDRDARPAPAASGTSPTRVGLVDTLRHGSDWVQAVAVSPDGRLAVSGGNDGFARAWDLETDRQVGYFRHDGPVFAVAFAPDGRRVASAGGGDHDIVLWEAEESGQEVGRFKGHTGQVNALAFDRRGGLLLSGSHDRTVRLWGADTGAMRWEATHDGAVFAVAFTPDGRTALSAGADRTVRLGKVGKDDNGSEIARLRDRGAAEALAVSPDGRLALACGNHDLLTVWDLSQRTEPRRLEGAPLDWPRCAAFLPDGRHALVGYQGGKLLLWDVDRGLVAHAFDEGPNAGHLGLALLPGASRALTADDDGHVRLWNLPRLGGTP